jgi:hypothetical protein
MNKQDIYLDSWYKPVNDDIKSKADNIKQTFKPSLFDTNQTSRQNFIDEFNKQYKCNIKVREIWANVSDNNLKIPILKQKNGYYTESSGRNTNFICGEKMVGGKKPSKKRKSKKSSKSKKSKTIKRKH